MTLDEFREELRKAGVDTTALIPTHAKFAGPCLMCPTGVFAGDVVLYCPDAKGVLCAECALQGDLP